MGIHSDSIYKDVLRKVEANKVKTKEMNIVHESLVVARTDAVVSGSAGTFKSPSFGDEKFDQLDEFSSDGFTPEERGFYLVCCIARSDTTAAADGDRIQSRLYNTTEGSYVMHSGSYYLGAAEDWYKFPPIAGIFVLNAGKTYKYQVRNFGSAFDICDTGGLFSVRRVFKDL